MMLWSLRIHCVDRSDVVVPVGALGTCSLDFAGPKSPIDKLIERAALKLFVEQNCS